MTPLNNLHASVRTKTLRHSKIYSIFIVVLSVFFLLPFNASCNDSLADALYRDPTATVEDRADDLLSRMTVDEKIGQLILVDWRYLDSAQDITNFKLGGLLGGGGSAPQPNNVATWADMIDGYQKVAQSTTLKIPLLIGNDAVHGVSNLKDATIFPHHIGLGAANDSQLVERIGAATAREAVALGINWNYSPAVSVPRDIRWGRTYEGFSSDPTIVSILGAAEIRGLQQINGILATAKHFVADGGTSLGRDRGDATLTDAELRSVHLPPYTAALESGVDVEVIMASYSSVNGVKMHQQSALLQDLLKQEMGFRGFIVSDWEAIHELPGSLDERVALAVNSGIDMIMEPMKYQSLAFALQRQVAQGAISKERLNEAVLRILKVKLRAGFFEGTASQRERFSQIRSDAHLALAREAVRKSAVLLKNDNKVLPFADSVRSVLVVGDHADDVGAQSGGWTITWQGRRGDITAGSTILEGVRARDESINVDYAANLDALNNITSTYDAVVVVVGEDPYAEGPGDNAFPALLPSHLQLLERAEKFGVPVVTIIISGRPLILGTAEQLSDAIVAAWLPGSEAGDGLAQLLWGDYPFSGRLPYQWPSNASAFRHGAGQVLYARGFGL